MTWQEFYTNTGIEQLIKWFLDLATNIVDKLNDFPKLFGKIPVAAMNTILSIVNGFKNFLLVILSSWQKNLQKMNDAAKKAAEERNKDELNKNKEKNEQIEQQNEESRKRDLDNAKQDNAEAANAEKAVQQAEHQAGRLERAGAKIKDKLGWLQDHKGISATIGAIGSGLQMLGMSASQANPILGSTISIIGTLGSALSTGLMSSGPGGWILAGISAIIGVVSIIEANYESSAEKLERLQKEAEDAKNAMLQSKNEVKSLDSAIKKLEELSNKRFESNEAYQEWIDYNNEVVEQYPELLGYIEGEGNTIANLATAYDLLSQAKQDYLDKTRDQVEAEEEARAQAIEMAERDLIDRGFDPNDAFKTVDLFGLGQSNSGNNFGALLNDYIQAMQNGSGVNVTRFSIEQRDKMLAGSPLLYDIMGESGIANLTRDSVMGLFKDHFKNYLDENGKIPIGQISEVQTQFMIAKQWMDSLANSDSTLYDALGGQSAVDELDKIINSFNEDYATLAAYTASISQSVTEGRASLRGFFTTSFYDDNRDWDNALMPLTDLMVAQVSDDELLKPEYFASGKASLDSSLIYTQTEEWYKTLEEGFVETYYQHLDLYSWNDIKEKAGLEKTNLTQEQQQQILDALYQKWLVASGYDEEFVKSNEDNLKSFSSQMEKYVSRAKVLLDSAGWRDNAEGAALNSVLNQVKELPIDTQKAVESILASGDLQSIVGVVDVMQKLQEQDLLKDELKNNLNELTKKLNVNLSLEWDNLTELMTQGIDDYEKDVAEATKGLNLADARTWSDRLEQDFDELFYVDDDKYYFKDLDNLQQFYNDKFNPYEEVLSAFQANVAPTNSYLVHRAFAQNDAVAIRTSQFYSQYPILMEDYLNSVDEYSYNTFMAWLESRDDEFKRTQSHFDEIALHRENESWASAKTSEYNNNLENIHLSFLQSAQKATVDDLAKLYNLTSEQITDELITNNGWFKLAGTNDYAMTYEAMLEQAEQAGRENNAAAQDLLHNALKTMLDTASKGIDGTLSEQDYINLVQQYEPLKNLNVAHTATGVKINELDQAYWILKDMIPYSEELTKFMEQAFKNVSTVALSREYRELQKILDAEGSLNQAQQNRKRTLEEILRLRAQEASSFDFMNRDLGGRNNPATYFDSLYKAMSAINESAESGTMSWDNWSRIWLQIQDSIMEGADIGMTAADVAQVMNEGLGALVDVGGTLSVDLAQIGLDMFNGSESMTDGMKKALENVAKSQIEIIDVQIKQLEAVAALEELDLGESTTEEEYATKVLTARSKLTDALSDLGFADFNTDVDNMDLEEVRAILTELASIWAECGDDATLAIAKIQEFFAKEYNWTFTGELNTDLTAKQNTTYESTVELDPEQAAQIEQNEKLTESAKNAATETETLNTTVEKTAKTSEISSKKLDQASRATDKIGDAAQAMISPAAQASDEVDDLTLSLQNLVASVSSLIKTLKEQFESAASTSATNNTGGTTAGSTNGAGRRTNNSTSGSSGPTKAKGTLMGELGPELFVTGGHYYIAGRSGAEFVDLPDDAIVFNHLQTQNLLRKGQSGRGLPVTNERNAVSFARGNVAMASAREAIQKLENAKSMWESLLNMPLSTMGKKAGSGGGGGGGGKSATAQLHDLERWYNLLRQIENTEKHITLEQNKRANMQNGYDYAKSLEQELKILQDQKRAYSELVGLQKSYYDERRKDLAASEYGKIFTYTEHGLQQEIMGENMGFDILAKLNATDVNGAPIGHAVDSKAQIAYLQSIGFDVNKLKINDDGTAAEDTDAQMQNFWNRVEGWRSEMDELYDAYHDGLVSWEKNIEEQNKILQEFIDNQLNVEDKLLKAVDERQQKLIDDLEDEHEKFADANQKYIEGLNKALEREQRMYEDSENDKELTQLQRRLAILVRSGGSAADIKSLQDEIDGKLKDNYFDQMQKQIEAVQEASDNQLEKLQTQIDLMTEQLEFQKENGMLWEEVYEMMNNWSAEEMMAFIERNTKDYLGDSTLKNEQNTAETLKELQIWKQGNELDMQSIQDQLAEGIMVHTAPERTEATGGASSAASSGSGGNSGGSGSSGSGTGGSTAKTSGTTAANPEVVKQLQKKLKTYNLYRGAIDGIYGSGTREAVKSLQNLLKMTAQDGLYGAGTKRKAEQHFKGTWPAGIYAAGGINTVTGPAWLDGTPQKPEAVLKADDYKLLKSSIFSNAKYSLKSAITSVNDLVNNLAHTGDGVVGESFTIGNVAINLESGVISSDYDARRAAKTIKDELLSIARKTGNLTK